MSYGIISILRVGSLRGSPLSGCAIGHTCGVRVQKVQRVQRVADCRSAVHSEHDLHYANWICKGASAT